MREEVGPAKLSWSVWYVLPYFQNMSMDPLIFNSFLPAVAEGEKKKREIHPSRSSGPQALVLVPVGSEMLNHICNPSVSDLAHPFSPCLTPSLLSFPLLSAFLQAGVDFPVLAGPGLGLGKRQEMRQPSENMRGFRVKANGGNLGARADVSDPPTPSPSSWD